MEIRVKAKRIADGWQVDAPDANGLSVSVPRLDKGIDKVKAAVADQHDLALCDVVVKLDAEMPGIICDLDAAREKFEKAAKLKEEAQTELKNVVCRMRQDGLTMRDVAVLLGVTPQRVAQIVGEDD